MVLVRINRTAVKKKFFLMDTLKELFRFTDCIQRETNVDRNVTNKGRMPFQISKNFLYSNSLNNSDNLYYFIMTTCGRQHQDGNVINRSEFLKQSPRLETLQFK
jgi:hypothetical protein